MIKLDIWSKKKEEILNNKIDKKIQTAWKKAIKDPYPSADSTLKYVYSKK